MEWGKKASHQVEAQLINRFKYYPRGKSSEASIEGNTSKKM